jgi:membrane fusion protein, multidrug efflux system
MRIGQPTTVWFDLYGSKVKYEGKVLGISSGTGSAFSLIPPQNATGNWIKIVQRLPVRISLDPEMVKKYPTRIGISANVEVDLSDQDLPMLAQISTAKPLETTTIFDINLKKINDMIDEVIQNNLNQENR